MKSTNITVRLKEEELNWLDAMASPRSGTVYNRSEFIRLLIHREHGRRTNGVSVVKDASVSTEWRVGKPKSQKKPQPGTAHPRSP